MKELLRSVSSSSTYPVPPFLLPHSFSPLATQVSPCRWKTNATRATFEECCWKWFLTESQNFATQVVLSAGHKVVHFCTILLYICICCVLTTYHLLLQCHFNSVLECTVCNAPSTIALPRLSESDSATLWFLSLWPCRAVFRFLHCCSVTLAQHRTPELCQGQLAKADSGQTYIHTHTNTYKHT